MAKPRVTRRELTQAAKLYSGFRERDVGQIRRHQVDVPRVAVAIGKVRAIEYETTHGDKGRLYRHDFATHARPAFCVSADGRQLLILPGKFIFTARGIVDRRKR